jgi:endonuclease/exonuclease/phosphatase family metal-dependent hydrolase
MIALMSESWFPSVHEAHHAVEPTTEPGHVLHVVTWNIQFGVQAAAAAEALRVHPELASADVVLLQEMDEDGTEAIARAVGLNSVFASSTVHPRTGRNFGNAVLSKWPLRDPEVVMLSHKSAVQGQYRIAVRATVTFGASDVDACSVHTEVPSLSPPKRRRQFEEIVEATEQWAPDRLVVGGDFNTLTGRGVAAVSERMHRIGAARVSAGAGATLRRGGKEFTLDHLFARGMSALDRGVVRGIAASDHRPLWVRLRATAV